MDDKNSNSNLGQYIWTCFRVLYVGDNLDVHVEEKKRTGEHVPMFYSSKLEALHRKWRDFTGPFYVCVERTFSIPE